MKTAVISLAFMILMTPIVSHAQYSNGALRDPIPSSVDRSRPVARYSGRPGQVAPGSYVPGLGWYVTPGTIHFPPTFPDFPNGTDYVVTGGWTLSIPFESPFLMVPVISPY